MVDTDTVFLEYAKTMKQAQLLEVALQAVAASEIDAPDRELSHEEIQERTEKFFSRSLWWIQKRLDASPELAREIQALRTARNNLAHGYLTQWTWLNDHQAASGEESLTDRLPEERLPEAAALMKAIARHQEEEAQAAVAELRDLRTRFDDCNSTILGRLLATVPYYSSWEECAQALRQSG